MNELDENLPSEATKEPKYLKFQESDIEKYKKYIEKKVRCHICENEVSGSRVLRLRSCRVCLECMKERINDINEIAEGEYEDRRNLDEKLYRCKRLCHFKPLYAFIKYSPRSGYTLNSLCVYCRQIKRLEYELKKKKIFIKK